MNLLVLSSSIASLALASLFFLAPADNGDSGRDSDTRVITHSSTTPDGGVVEIGIAQGQNRQGTFRQSDPVTPGETQAALGHRPPPKNVNLGCTGQIQGGLWSGNDLCPIDFPDETPPEEIPPIDLLYHALSQAKVEGAGLRVQPHIKAYVGVPTLVHATQPTRSEMLHILGYDVTVNFAASSYKYDFGDGLPPLVTTDPSGPYPITTLRHVYQQPFPSQTVTLETMWTATVTHPVTGEVLAVPGAMITRERSAPFEVRKAKGYLTDTAEELQGR